MRGPLVLVMENDWDLQAVVRSCAASAHAEEPAGGARHAPAPEPQPPEPETAALQERRAPAPVVANPCRASATTVLPNKQEASRLYGLDYLDLDHKPFLLPPINTTAPAASRDDVVREVMISFPAASGMQSRAVPPGRKPGARGTPRPKRSKKSQLKKVVREMPVADGGASSSDPWAWRKYGQKPIKGSPYPRGYYKCSSMKGCMARKLVERSPAKPGVLIVTYMAEHCHPVPTQLNALAGTTRHTKSAAVAEEHPAASSSPKSHEQQGLTAADSNEAPPVAVDQCGGAALLADDEGEFWPVGMDMDELLAPVDDDFDFEHVLDDDGGGLERRLSL
ncbi:hypothetical protein PR202_ga10444 [Eleusine coracana subsp. coracana]|uniref:WRKY domain-containing protein n=1 Tax=Eleusine coracana subsp. coracana TaxID=191504 RepID=A0AAV5C6R2_ELECO|nr:hypothetical protein QOZ80_1AG0025260 [Eleusine coracana subsp. coracana]GJM93852.1 hypothetical protein PR202_ga10444 [Eleusine coracana subsp. coracana]